MPSLSFRLDAIASARRWLIVALAVTSLGARVGYAQGGQHVDTVPPPRRIVSAPWDAAQSGWAGRMVVGEYITGTFCGPCQYHEEAFNALLRRYPASAFISLAYQEEVNPPLGDPADSNQVHLVGWYGVGGSPPGLFGDRGFDDWIDGHSTPGAPENALEGQHVFASMVPVIDAELQRPPEAFVRVQATVQGGQVIATVHVDSLTGRHAQVFLRLLLVEDTVTLVSPHIEQRWTGLDSLHVAHPFVRPLRREYHMVVRASAHMPGLSLGLPVQVPGTVQYPFDVAAIQRRHQHYYQVATQQVPPVLEQDSVHRYLQPYMDADWLADFQDYMGMFTALQDWTINPQRLHLVAFVQDAHSGAVLQAAMVPVDGRQLILP
ncbi:MAG TPA: hypothetical protein VNU46_01160 [Gemmatimonadaceae bacterium]|jgi:hypothetical protein|nr:hypothetical protein [Gemmatimonadaceae bacterium]